MKYAKPPGVALREWKVKVCSNCEKPLYIKRIDTCDCSIWDRGKKKEQDER